ncbi:polysaccharide deacetylase family protein [Undibacterium sp.]|uniref:polysaccharide deacetylase family protein n=1 Tax=Undibacterium sp. TaxID=1914977 RepID=UPI002B5AAE1F|nr:polysaccharide deacetylase family protein [Undibacterium sp.]HTD02870.1 polysaccharide deacetylase family protein [Undibacterium sp.]
MAGFLVYNKAESGRASSGASSPSDSSSLVPAEILEGPQQLLAAYRKIIVLLADEKNLGSKEKAAANQVGQALFHENLGRLGKIDGQLKQWQALSVAQREASYDAMLTYIESGTDLYDADRLAFREVLISMQKLAAAEQTLPAIKLHKRISEDLIALDDIEKQYDQELKGIFSRFDSRAIEPKRERWDDYLAHLRAVHTREQIMKDYGVILPYPQTPAMAASDAKEGKEARSNEIFGAGLPPKTVVLSFDDGPHPRYTAEIAAILKQYNVPAVFFEVGKNIGSVNAQGKETLGSNAKISKALLAAGYTLGNHSYSHALLSKQTGDSLHDEITQTDQLLKAVDAGRAPLFRFPYGAHNKEGMELLSSLGLRSVMWNIDSLDWADPVPSSIADRVLSSVSKEQRGIILFHDIHERSIKALPLVLDKLIADGYSFAGWDGKGFSVSKDNKPSTEKSASVPATKIAGQL